MNRQRFALLNLLLLMMIATAPILEGGRPVAIIVYTLWFVVILISAVYAVGHRWHARRVVLPLAVLASLAQILNMLTAKRWVAIASDLLGIVALLIVILLIIRRLFSVNSADYEAINAAVCAYLLMGILWAIAYSLVELVAPGSFSYPLRAEAPSNIRIGGEYTIVPLYYSFVTMTTLGYGDIVPIGSAAKVLAMFQAGAGQIYLVVLVARLVGLQVSTPDGGKD